MAREPVDKQCRYLRGQDYYWRIIRVFGQADALFTVTDVSDETNGEKDSVREYMNRLEKAGYIERAGARASDGVLLFRVLKDSRWTPRVRRDGSEVEPSKQDHMWRAMKMLGRFTARDLAVFASTETVAVSEVHAQDYIKHLVRAGYLNRLSGSPRSYAMIKSKNTGPRAPYVQRVKQVFDPNLNKVVWRSGNDE